MLVTRSDGRKCYKKCEKCGRVFKCESEHKKLIWMKHRIKCSFARKKPSVPTALGCNITDTPLPYVIPNGLTANYQELPTSIKQRLDEFYICVIDNYASKEVAMGVKDELLYLSDSTQSHFYQAGLGGNENRRSGLVYWMNGKEPKTAYINILKRSINTLMTSLKFNEIPNITHFTHFQVTCFPEKSFGYATHVDNPSNNGCLLTVVYYCNENYNRKKDGGVHRFFLYDKRSVVDIEPRFNRIVIYWSDVRVAHGTCRCFRRLFSLSSWYFNSIDKSTETSTSTSTTTIF